MRKDRPLIIVHDGDTTNLFIDGKVYGDGITGISFQHKGKKFPKKAEVSLEVTADDVVIEGESDFSTIYALMSKIEQIIQGEGRE